MTAPEPTSGPLVTDYASPVMVELCDAYVQLRAAEQRVEAACRSARAAGYAPVGVNRWERIQ